METMLSGMLVTRLLHDATNWNNQVLAFTSRFVYFSLNEPRISF